MTTLNGKIHSTSEDLCTSDPVATPKTTNLWTGHHEMTPLTMTLSVSLNLTAASWRSWSNSINKANSDLDLDLNSDLDSEILPSCRNVQSAKYCMIPVSHKVNKSLSLLLHANSLGKSWKVLNIKALRLGRRMPTISDLIGATEHLTRTLCFSI